MFGIPELQISGYRSLLNCTNDRFEIFKILILFVEIYSGFQCVLHFLRRKSNLFFKNTQKSSKKLELLEVVLDNFRAMSNKRVCENKILSSSTYRVFLEEVLFCFSEKSGIFLRNFNSV